MILCSATLCLFIVLGRLPCISPTSKATLSCFAVSKLTFSTAVRRRVPTAQEYLSTLKVFRNNRCEEV
jgi:hypothetical protein